VFLLVLHDEEHVVEKALIKARVEKVSRRESLQGLLVEDIFKMLELMAYQ
jgi:hypothetical protein